MFSKQCDDIIKAVSGIERELPSLSLLWKLDTKSLIPLNRKETPDTDRDYE
jgi:hypothetical protein